MPGFIPFTCSLTMEAYSMWANLPSPVQWSPKSARRFPRPGALRRRWPTETAINGSRWKENWPFPARINGASRLIFSTEWARCRAGEWVGRAGVGELGQIRGRTGPGVFSPVICASQPRLWGNGAGREPIRPEWDQLMNGSLDAECLDLHGLRTAISPRQMTLLTPD